MMIAVLPLIVALVGVLMFALCANQKLARVGEILFFVGVLWLVYSLAGKTLRIG